METVKTTSVSFTQIGEKNELPVLFLDVSNRAVAVLSGSDGQDLLQRISTNDLTKLSRTNMVQTILTNEKGRIVEVISVLKLDDAKLLLVGQSTDVIRLTQWMEKFIIMEDAHIQGIGNTYAHYLLFGVDQHTHWSRIFGTNNIIAGDFQIGLPIGSILFREMWDSIPLIHIMVPAEKKEELQVTLEALSLKESSKIEYDLFRAQHSIPASPNELNDLYNPLEANLWDLISWTKGCYIGQEVIARLDTYKKVQRRLTKVELETVPDLLLATLFDDKEEVGMITSAAPVNPGQSIGLAYVKTGVLERRALLYFKQTDKRFSAIIKE